MAFEATNVEPDQTASYEASSLVRVHIVGSNALYLSADEFSNVFLNQRKSQKYKYLIV